MLEQLYQGLYSDGHFTGSFQDFQTKMQDPEYRKRLHAGIVSDGDFTGDLMTFENKFMGKCAKNSTSTLRGVDGAPRSGALCTPVTTNSPLRHSIIFAARLFLLTQPAHIIATEFSYCTTTRYH